MSGDNDRSVMSVSTSSVSLGGVDTSIGHDPFSIYFSVHVSRNVPLEWSLNTVRSEHTQSVPCIPVVK